MDPVMCPMTASHFQELLLLIPPSLQSPMTCLHRPVLLVEDSVLDASVVYFLNLGSTEATLHNVTFTNHRNKANPVAYFTYGAVLLVNCTFENNVVPGIYATGSKVIMEGSIVFSAHWRRNAIALKVIHVPKASYSRLV
jgi:hypothetical protein